MPAKRAARPPRRAGQTKAPWGRHGAFSSLRRGHHACADRASALAEREPDAGLECHRPIEGEGDLGPAARRQLDVDPEGRGHVGGAQEQLRPVAGADRPCPTAFLRGQEVELGPAAPVRLDRPRCDEDLAADDVAALDVAQPEADVLTGPRLALLAMERLDRR